MLLFVGLIELVLLFVAVLCWATGFIVVTALLGGVIESGPIRSAIGIACTLLVPIFWHLRLRRRSKTIASSPFAFIALCSALIGIGLSLGFADDVGRALRRHGDWFLGERNGAIARAARNGLEMIAARLERYDPAPELAPTILPPDPVPLGPYLPGQEPPPAPPKMLAWFHPLAGGERAMPGSESRRFGAVRPQPRPSECELGHCGVDLGHVVGQAVVAVHDGVVERIEMDEARGGRAGRYVRVGHVDGTVVSRYIHLDSVRADLREGMHIAGGEIIGRVGHTGIEHSGPHLHFGLSLRPSGHPGGNEKYVDPEPLLAKWSLTS